MKFCLNNSWSFKEGFNGDDINNYSGYSMVRIPHTFRELDYNYINNLDYQMVGSYYTKIDLSSYKGKIVFLCFDGSAHETTIYVNGKEAYKHKCGYTKFKLRIDELADSNGICNVIARVDSSEGLNQPPFGYVIDYLTYGGIYRDTYLDIRNAVYFDDIFADGNSLGDLSIKIKYNKENNYRLHIKIANVDEIIANKELVEYKGLPIRMWDTDNPNLYPLLIELIDDNKNIIDSFTTNVGFRSIKSDYKGIYLNNKLIKLRGLNRHQSYPYIGYAATKRLERNDAYILKHELGLNAVRTSHYPQSEAFISECDRLGLLVFTEIPGWQHIGDLAWQDQAVKNTHDMIMDLRNHPSIFIWGVRINESADNHDFYMRTNAMAKNLDSTRLIGGVRCFEGSELLEDVYTFNDFYHNGKNEGCRNRAMVTKDRSKAYLVTEYNGHMYPTKSFDDEIHRTNHLLRHLSVMNAVALEKNHAGGIGWCMADYNTHKDFGSGDNICYHGVLDMFRCPKLAAFAYKAEGVRDIVMESSTNMNIGEYPESKIGDTYVLTNLDSVRAYKGDRLINEFYPRRDLYKGLNHPPIILDDLVGDELKNNEGYSPRAAKQIKKCLLSIKKTGFDSINLKTRLLLLKLMLFNGLTTKGVRGLYDKYVGGWGDLSSSYTLVGVKNGKEVIKKSLESYRSLSFSVTNLSNELEDNDTYDMDQITIEAINQADIHLPYFNEAIRVEAIGNIELVGPSTIAFKGGYASFYIKTKAKGSGTINIYYKDKPIKEISYTIN